MKTINVTFTDKEFAKITKVKKTLFNNGSWQRFIVSMCTAPKVLK